MNYHLLYERLGMIICRGIVTQSFFYSGLGLWSFGFALFGFACGRGNLMTVAFYVMRHSF